MVCSQVEKLVQFDKIGEIANELCNNGRIEAISSYDLALLVEDNWLNWESGDINYQQKPTEFYNYWRGLLMERFGVEESLASIIGLTSDRISMIMATGYTVFKGAHEDPDYDAEIIEHSAHTEHIWELVCGLYVGKDKETKLVEALIKNVDDEKFPIGWLIDEYDVETGDQQYILIK